METILVLIDAEEGKPLSGPALETLGAAAALSAIVKKEVVVGLIGSGDLAKIAAGLGGAATKVVTFADAALKDAGYARDVFAAEKIVKAVNPGFVLAPASSRWNRALPGVAERAGGKIDTHITTLEDKGGKAAAGRWYYRQRIFGKIHREQNPWFMTIETGSFAKAAVGSGAAPAVSSVAEAIPASRSKVLGLKSLTGGKQTIKPDADLLLVAGAGWTKTQKDGAKHAKDAEGLILAFLEKYNASLGSSKAATDLAAEGGEALTFMTQLHQVGQTGASPRHAKGLATCCFGEEPHVVGWRFINERRAIDLNANCGWAQGKADVLYVADVFEVFRELAK